MPSWPWCGRARFGKAPSCFAPARCPTGCISSKPGTRYLALLRENPALVQQVPQRHIATYLGVKPESLSRMRAQL